MYVIPNEIAYFSVLSFMFYTGIPFFITCTQYNDHNL